MATQDQNPNATNQPKEGNSPQNNPKNESGKDRGLEQNDHTYEGENDVTHSPQKTGDPKNQSTQSSSGSFRGESKFTPEDASAKQNKTTGQAGYNQAEHDKTPEANAKNANASDPRKSDEPKKGNL